MNEAKEKNWTNFNSLVEDTVSDNLSKTVLEKTYQLYKLEENLKRANEAAARATKEFEELQKETEVARREFAHVAKQLGKMES